MSKVAWLWVSVHDHLRNKVNIKVTQISRFMLCYKVLNLFVKSQISWKRDLTIISEHVQWFDEFPT